MTTSEQVKSIVRSRYDRFAADRGEAVADCRVCQRGLFRVLATFG